MDDEKQEVNTQDAVTGGAAFPTLRTSHDDQGNTLVLHDGDVGMTLLDYFAVRAPAPDETMAATLYGGTLPSSIEAIAETIAKWQYIYAAAMLKQRQKVLAAVKVEDESTC